MITIIACYRNIETLYGPNMRYHHNKRASRKYLPKLCVPFNKKDQNDSHCQCYPIISKICKCIVSITQISVRECVFHGPQTLSDFMKTKVNREELSLKIYTVLVNVLFNLQVNPHIFTSFFLPHALCWFHFCYPFSQNYNSLPFLDILTHRLLIAFYAIKRLLVYSSPILRFYNCWKWLHFHILLNWH